MTNTALQNRGRSNQTQGNNLLDSSSTTNMTNTAQNRNQTQGNNLLNSDMNPSLNLNPDDPLGLRDLLRQNANEMEVDSNGDPNVNEEFAIFSPLNESEIPAYNEANQPRLSGAERYGRLLAVEERCKGYDQKFVEYGQLFEEHAKRMKAIEDHAQGLANRVRALETGKSLETDFIHESWSNGFKPTTVGRHVGRTEDKGKDKDLVEWYCMFTCLECL